MAYRMVHYLDIPSPEPAANPAFATAASGLAEIAQFFNSIIIRNRADLTQCRSGSFGQGRRRLRRFVSVVGADRIGKITVAVKVGHTLLAAGLGKVSCHIWFTFPRRTVSKWTCAYE
jgi:hypothetical protein